MGIAIVGSAALANQNNVNTNAVSVTRTLTAGNCAIAVATIARSTTFTISSVTDGSGNTWTLLSVGTAEAAGAFCRVALAYALNVTGGATTVTFNLSSTAATFSNCGVSEFSSVATTNAQDATSTRSEVSTAAADISATAITTSRPGDVIYGVAMIRSGADTNLNFASPTSWTNVYRQNNAITGGQGPSMDAGYWLPGSVQTGYAPQWTHDNAAGEEGAVVVLALQQPAYTLTASVGTFTLTGVATGLTAQRKMSTSVGTFTLTGNNASLIYSGGVAFTSILRTLMGMGK